MNRMKRLNKAMKMELRTQKFISCIYDFTYISSRSFMCADL